MARKINQESMPQLRIVYVSYFGVPNVILDQILSKISNHTAKHTNDYDNDPSFSYKSFHVRKKHKRSLWTIRIIKLLKKVFWARFVILLRDYSSE